MIYRREEYVEQGDEKAKFPVKHIEVLQPVGKGPARFVGQLTLGMQTPAGIQQIPIHFAIEADSIEDAFRKFDALAEVRVEEAQKQIEEEIGRMRREASSRIVRPDEVMRNAGGAPKIVDFDGLRGQ